MAYVIVAVVSILVGGFGGYRWGAAVEKKAAAALASAASGVGSAVKKI